MSGSERVLASTGETVQAFGGYREGRQSRVAAGPIFRPDLSQGNLIVVEVEGDVQVLPPLLPLDSEGRGVGFVLILVQDGIGGHAVTWHEDFKWQDGDPVIVAAVPGGITQVGAMTYDDGATWLGGGSSGYS